MGKTFTKNEAIKVITNAAENYSENLENKNFAILYKDRQKNRIDYFETVFLPRNFQHLTGLEYINEKGEVLKKSVDFYEKCVKHNISEKEIRFKNDGTTQLKLQALPKLVNFYQSSKMIATLDIYRPQSQKNLKIE